MAELSNEEREKIYLEEKARHEARKELEAAEEKERIKIKKDKERQREIKKELDFFKIPFFFIIPFLFVLLGTYKNAGAGALENSIFSGIFFGIILSAIFGFKKKSVDNVSTSSSVKSPNEISSSNKIISSITENNLVTKIDSARYYKKVENDKIDSVALFKAIAFLIVIIAIILILYILLPR